MDKLLNNDFVGSLKKATFVNYSLLGGLLASAGSMFGKFSSSFEELGLMKFLTFGLMLLFNTIGMLYFAKSLQAAPTSIHATLVSSASNYIFTAIIGSVIFNEKTSFLWWVGTTFVVSGIVIISSQMKTEKQKDS